MTFQLFYNTLMLVYGHTAHFRVPSPSLSFLRQKWLLGPGEHGASDYWVELLPSNNESEDERVSQDVSDENQEKI